MAAIARYHAEWLSLMDVSGPFLSVPVLSEVFPNGLVAHDSVTAAELRAAYDDWSDPAGAGYDDSEAVHRAFVDFVLHRVLGLRKDDIVRDAESLKADFSAALSTPAVTLVPDAVVMVRGAPGLLVTILPRSVAPDQPVPGDEWTASPRERMVEMLRGTECPLGLVTDGERWTLVARREGEAPGYATWWASLWREERITLQSFRTLLGEDRFFSAPDGETLVGLLERSAQDQSEVTTKLGNQTLEAVEILMRRLDQLDRDRRRDLLKDIPEPELYDAAVTVMMRLVFLFFAEENDLLPMNEDLWQTEYAASSLRARLQKAADEGGEEVLEAHSDAWPRLLATWRAVHGGVEHGDMRLAPYGGSLFDPNRYPFLEGRLPGSSWEEANPLPVDNRTVLHLLNALQTLQEAGQKRKLSFRALDVEQIGHVYEGMLDHTAARAEGWVLGLSGTGGREPEIPLEKLEALNRNEQVKLLSERTGRGAAAIETWLDVDAADEVRGRFGNHWAPAFAGDADAEKRVQRFAKFIRTDSFGAPTIFQPGSVYVCDSSHRGATGTHYTPRSFTVEMVGKTLDPLVYEGIAEGRPESEWRLRPPQEILDLKVGDPACGSGAFLVQACRYLSTKLVESRGLHGELNHEPTEEDLIHARREVAGRCLYGVDVNPMAAEMAKLSLWLVTLERDKPFSFLDHAIGVGDSLVGLTSLDQLRRWSPSGNGDPQEMLTGIIRDEVEHTLVLREGLGASPVVDLHDIEHKRLLLAECKETTSRLRSIADLLFVSSFAQIESREAAKLRDGALHFATRHIRDPDALARYIEPMRGTARPFHWMLEFPEVLASGGFDAIVGNPPFLGGGQISGVMGPAYLDTLKSVFGPAEGRVDLCVFFFKRAFRLTKAGGSMGLVATDSISQTANRRAGLDQLVNDADIYAANKSVPWPGKPSLRVAKVHLWKGGWRGRRLLDGQSVDRIGPDLSDAPDPRDVARLGSRVRYFTGTMIYGASFILDSRELELALVKNPGLRPFIRRFVNGDVLNGTAECDDGRAIVDFGELDEDYITGCDAILAKLKRDVTIERSAQTRQVHEHRPWLHWDKRTESYAEARRLAYVFCMAADSSHLMLRRCDPNWLFNHKIKVLVSEDWWDFAVLQSAVHEAWLYFMGGSRGGAVSYSTRNVLDTFPWPEETSSEAAAAGDKFHAMREQLCGRWGVGLIDVHNALGDPHNSDVAVRELRELLAEVTYRVWSSYGGRSKDLEFTHRTFGRRTRFFLTEDSERLVVRTLVRSNRAAHARG
jgi:hypothetical protein